MNRIALLLAIALGASGFFLLQRHKQRFEHEVSGGSLVPVVVARQDIPLGAQVTEDLVAVRELPAKYLEDRHILASDARRILGVRTSMGVRANESVLWTDLATASASERSLSGLVQQGMRAVTVRASHGSSLGGLLRPGDRVDLLLTTERGSGGEVTIPLLQNLLVLAVGSDTGAPDGSQMRSLASADVTLSATVAQAQALVHASTSGALSLVLRNPDDISVARDLPETTAADIQLAERIARLQNRRGRTEDADDAKKEIERVSSDR